MSSSTPQSQNHSNAAGHCDSALQSQVAHFIELAGRWPNGGFERYQFMPSSANPRRHPFVRRLIRAGGDVYRSIAEYPAAKRSDEHRCPNGVLDIDCEGNLEQARMQTVAVVERLGHDLGRPEHDIWVTFSGHKGFHVILSRDLFGEVAFQASIWTWRALAFSLKDEVAPSTDLSIYRVTGMIRCPNTLNTKSGRFDIPLETAELKGLSIADIQELAKNPRPDNPWTSPEMSEKAAAWLEERIADGARFQRPTHDITNAIRRYRRGWHTPPCVRLAERATIPDDWRHQALESLARFYASIGMASDEICERIEEIDTRNPIRDPDFIPRMVGYVSNYPKFRSCPSIGLSLYCKPDDCPLRRLSQSADSTLNATGDS